MPNSIAVTVEQPDQVLNAGLYGAGAVVRLQWSATEAGAYADVSGTGSTPTIPVVTLVRSYTGYDPLGTVSTFYRTRYENSGATRLSDWSTPFQVAEEGSGLLCSLWDVKQALGITATDTTEDENILEFIREVSAEIQDYTGRRFARNPSSGTATFLLEVTSDGQTLYVPQGIAALTTLEVATSSQPETGGTYTTVTAADVFLRPYSTSRSYGWPATSIQIADTSGSQFYTGQNTVRIVGALGWDKVPANIAAIARRAVIGGFLGKGSGAANQAIVGPSGQMLVLRGIGPEDQRVLDRFRIPSIA